MNRRTRHITRPLLWSFLILFLSSDVTSLPTIQTKVPHKQEQGILTAANGTVWTVKWPTQQDILKQELQSEEIVTVPSLESVDFAMVLAFMTLSGIVEAISYRYFKCFPNMMTGNTVKFLDSIVDARWNDSLWSACMVLSYVLGISIYKVVEIRQSPQQRIPNTVGIVAKLTLVTFGLSDIMYHFFLKEILERWRLPLLALGFGMLNAVCSDVWGAVTYALTGHFHKVGSGLTETALLGTPKNQAFQKSAWGLVAFATSMFTTSCLLRLVVVNKWLLNGRLPPFGLTLGILYGILLTGYSYYYESFSLQTFTAKGN